VPSGQNIRVFDQPAKRAFEEGDVASGFAPNSAFPLKSWSSGADCIDCTISNLVSNRGVQRRCQTLVRDRLNHSEWPHPRNMRDRKPLHQLVAEHAGALQTYFRRRIRQSANAPDLAQEVFLRLLRAGETKDIGNPEAYLFTVAAHLVQEYAVAERRHSSRRVAMSDPMVIEQMTIDWAPDRDADARLRVCRLRAILCDLPPRPFAALKMVYEEELSFAAVGARLGVSKTMAVKIVAQALEHCRRRMAPWEEGDGESEEV
jgi:RNA polymerase sigma factor (sigma-70 family)